MSLLSIADLGPDGLRQMLDLGRRLADEPDAFRSALAGRSVGLFFMKQSLRTWVSCDVAAIQLGMHPIVIRNDQTGMGTRETPADVGRVLDRYLDAVGLRVFDHADLIEIDRVTVMPVINLLSDREHPCQAVADLMTIEAVKPLHDVTIAYLGDGDNNVCRSLMVGAAMANSSIRIGAPEEHRPDEASVALARQYGEVVVTTDPREAVAGADVVYTDVWTSMGQEAEEEERRRVMSPFRVDESLFATASADAIFLHCLPAHRGEEVTDAVMDHPRSRVFDQAENRLHGFKAVLLHLLG